MSKPQKDKATLGSEAIDVSVKENKAEEVRCNK